MKTLMALNYEACTPEEIAALPLRRAARAVMFDAENKMALLHVARDGYYKLPGGGVDEGETLVEALHRECLEETGCKIQVGEEIGLVIEYRRSANILQESYVYFARVVGEKGEVQFTDNEKQMGCAIVWMTLDEAMAQMSTQYVSFPDGTKALYRDGLLLLEAKRRLAM